MSGIGHISSNTDYRERIRKEGGMVAVGAKALISWGILIIILAFLFRKGE